MRYFDPRLPDPGAFLERILSPTKMAPALFSLRLEIGFARKFQVPMKQLKVAKAMKRILVTHYRFTTLLLLLFVITFMLGIYYYTPEINSVPRVYSVAAVLHLQFIVHVCYFAC
jgi:hypothetical protein